MLVSRLGEFGLIERFAKLIKTDASVVKGPGDDCAVLKLDKDNYQLFTCDMIVEGVDFTRKDNPYYIGRKALAVSVSDIAACGGVPRHAVVSVGMPKDTCVTFLDKVFKGFLDCARKFKINLVGGDVSRAQKLVIDVSMLGSVKKKHLVLRSGAKKGDIVFVSGPLGGSIRGKHLTFTPRVREARFLVEHFKINAMIDITDGLLQDLGHILEQSSKGAVVFGELIPMAKEARSLDEALSMGEDFELLFTVSSRESEKILKKNSTFIPIGEITDKKHGLKLIDKNGIEKPCKPKGFRHF